MRVPTLCGLWVMDLDDRDPGARVKMSGVPVLLLEAPACVCTRHKGPNTVVLRMVHCIVG